MRKRPSTRKFVDFQKPKTPLKRKCHIDFFPQFIQESYDEIPFDEFKIAYQTPETIELESKPFYQWLYYNYGHSIKISQLRNIIRHFFSHDYQGFRLNERKIFYGTRNDFINFLEMNKLWVWKTILSQGDQIIDTPPYPPIVLTKDSVPKVEIPSFLRYYHFDDVLNPYSQEDRADLERNFPGIEIPDNLEEWYPEGNCFVIPDDFDGHLSDGFEDVPDF